ncbi:hypothetical protein H6P81_003380 [Aristolochia fimbriata]|uniref:Uncharacterized protein n=1 Tax=Aristolochia fimbriata TaxID=158543 RepID=A0AAV7FCE5_ARIFI|nr:hypothetical protein H6P81_003380 [Aristolochia fimbriata]
MHPRTVDPMSFPRLEKNLRECADQQRQQPCRQNQEDDDKERKKRWKDGNLSALDLISGGLQPVTKRGKKGDEPRWVPTKISVPCVRKQLYQRGSVRCKRSAPPSSTLFESERDFSSDSKWRGGVGRGGIGRGRRRGGEGGVGGYKRKIFKKRKPLSCQCAKEIHMVGKNVTVRAKTPWWLKFTAKRETSQTLRRTIFTYYD